MQRSYLLRFYMNQRNWTRTIISRLKSKWVCPRERFLDPLPHINFVHDHLFFSKFFIIYFFVIQGQVRLRHFLGRALRLGQARGPSAAARMGQGAERCGHGLSQLRHFLGRALWIGQNRGPSAAATGQVKLRHFL